MSEATQASQQQLPLFFTSIAPIDVDRHTGLRYDREAKADFARHTNSVPLGLSEITVASQFYPIIFTADPKPMPVAVLGFKTAQNVFMNEDSSWVPGMYVPAYVRAYPFMMMDDTDNNRSILAADLQSSALSTEKGEHLFKMGKPTPFIEEIYNFCFALREDFRRSTALGEALEKAKLLDVSQANLKLKSGEEASINGFKLLNAKKFEEANDKAFLEWRKNGWLAPIYAHLLSGARWDRIVARAEGAATV